MATAYRADIDGLRAVAVLLVLLFHADVPALAGGFIGVDVFFVVSGFLITSIVHREALAGTFTFSGFYRRRILRLMPALFAVLAVTTIVAVILLLPSELESYARSLVATTFSVANVYFWRQVGGYFDGSAAEAPLLHAWSLAVEEQFYFVWPSIVLFGIRWWGARGLRIATVALFVGSVALSEYALRTTYGAAYYLLPTRMFELLIGSAIALAWEDLPRPGQRAGDLLSLAALATILVSGLGMSRATPFPGFSALVPTLATGVLIVTGGARPAIANRMLAARPLVFGGLISYSLYLWHWPIIVFTRYVGVPMAVPGVMFVLLLSTALAWLTWKYVEQPYRGRSAVPFRRVLWSGYAFPTLVSALVAVVLLRFDGLPERFSERTLAMDAALASRPDVERGPCHTGIRAADERPRADCRFGADPARRRALLIGDSHANHFTGFLDELARPAGVSIEDYTLDGCAPLPDLDLGGREFFQNACRRRNALAYAHIASSRFDFVILSAVWPTDRGLAALASRDRRRDVPALEAHVRARLFQALETIVESGAIPVVVTRGATTTHGARCPLVRARFRSNLECDTPRAAADAEDALLVRALASARERWPALIVIDPKRGWCLDESCLAEVDGVPVFRDEAHLNERGSHAIGSRFLRLYGSPFNGAEAVTLP